MTTVTLGGPNNVQSTIRTSEDTTVRDVVTSKQVIEASPAQDSQNLFANLFGPHCGDRKRTNGTLAGLSRRFISAKFANSPNRCRLIVRTLVLFKGLRVGLHRA